MRILMISPLVLMGSVCICNTLVVSCRSAKELVPDSCRASTVDQHMCMPGNLNESSATYSTLDVLQPC